MNKIYVYMAGPITGCTDVEANDWREEFAGRMSDYGRPFVGVSPLRCEPIIGDLYLPEYDDNMFGHPSVIAAKNKEDVKRCDITVAWFPPNPPISVGTLQEIGWAVGMCKPVILITDNDAIRENAVIKGTVPWRFTDKEGGRSKAIKVIHGIYDVYT